MLKPDMRDFRKWLIAFAVASVCVGFSADAHSATQPTIEEIRRHPCRSMDDELDNVELTHRKDGGVCITFWITPGLDPAVLYSDGRLTLPPGITAEDVLKFMVYMDGVRMKRETADHERLMKALGKIAASADTGSAAARKK